MIKVKFFNMHMHRSNDPMDSSSYAEDQGRMEGMNHYFIPDKSYIYKDLQLTCENDYDYAVVLDQVFTANYFNPEKSILIRLEPEILRNGFIGYQQAVDASKFLKVYDIYTLWSIPYDLLDFSNVTKTKILSSLISENYSTFMHRKRYDFVQKINDRFPFFEHYGRGSFSNLHSYKGSPISRIEALRDYKYHFNAENSRDKSGFSEKILDSVLAECLTFYDGCPEMERYIHPDSFIRVDLDDYEKSLYIMENAINNNEYEKRIDIIKQTKWDIFNKLNPLELAYNGIHGYKNYFED